MCVGEGVQLSSSGPPPENKMASAPNFPDLYDLCAPIGSSVCLVFVSRPAQKKNSGNTAGRHIDVTLSQSGLFLQTLHVAAWHFDVALLKSCCFHPLVISSAHLVLSLYVVCFILL